ncbi:50S ribosomal protein L3 [bacterium (Candidatus Moisslbacteria) CG12_big_fil_rev_8_21_14_0_65_36_11]|nr:50S ribosomal protein L3 [Candidatus Kuenenbacteria bacterium]OIP76374.1 MAG: 50S ribosomal protein L3 [Parcubacteria group bacterium CG2_30_36_38]PIV45987.1 MAG: 50S ribosomal protein L3 [bacterium (Candidatus Moisslbacteria) CG02_land_8_20_14_3_00_36_53]PIW68125.1 MAG: 50S ribosomal protein L3 [bacterium (Candidatus Moisslbacteria) CG12_big_fil_rev_8_21_14_0_65_36_11]PIZ90460.1 MAG: 50S ribosomal protein L3 [bacterium (Candidatus Moisslbacteria) CG_4_10_14_0_2_um_filter_36_61]PJC00887.1 M
MAFILGLKEQMTQIFQDDKVMPVTVIKAGPCTVLDSKTKEKNGYEAVRMSLGEKKKITKPLEGQLKELEIKPRFIREFKTEEALKFKRGDIVKVDVFREGELINAQGVSIGKGFQGVVKRHHFHGKNTSHGTKHDVRRSGSIGTTAPQRVFKGKRMAGRMGGQRITLKNLKIIKIDPEKNLLYIKGAVPGKRGSLLKIMSINQNK